METKGRLIGVGFYWDDLKIGDKFLTHRRTITETDLVQFVNLTWLTEELFTVNSSEEKILPGGVVPGALVYSFAEGLLLPFMQDTGLAFLGTEIRMHSPAVVGDTIHVECEVVVHRSTSKPGRGLVRTQNQVVKENGEVVLTYNPVRMLRKRNPESL